MIHNSLTPALRLPDGKRPTIHSAKLGLGQILFQGPLGDQPQSLWLLFKCVSFHPFIVQPSFIFNSKVSFQRYHIVGSCAFKKVLVG